MPDPLHENVVAAIEGFFRDDATSWQFDELAAVVAENIRRAFVIEQIGLDRGDIDPEMFPPGWETMFPPGHAERTATYWKRRYQAATAVSPQAQAVLDAHPVFGQPPVTLWGPYDHERTPEMEIAILETIAGRKCATCGHLHNVHMNPHTQQGGGNAGDCRCEGWVYP